MTMIKIVHAKWVKNQVIALAFSDGSEGEYDFAAVLANESPLTHGLQDNNKFQRFYLELGALCWSNGLEFSAGKLHMDLRAVNRLHQTAKAA